MAQITPFAALRPTQKYASRVAALPYDVMNTEEARDMAAGNPYSFLHVDKAEIGFPPGIAFNDPSVYEKARTNLQQLITKNILKQDEKPCYYIYRLTVNGRSQAGLAACVNVKDYDNGLIKKHEFTRADKEQDRIDHIKACQAHTGPIFLTCRIEDEARKLMADWIFKNDAVYDFISDGVKQELWVVNNEASINALTQAFEPTPYLYIADGHHRSAAACKSGGSDKFLAVIFPHDELVIMDYNRLVKDLNGLTTEAFLQTLAKDFDVSESGEPVKPVKLHEYGMYIQGKWYRLRYTAPPPVDVVEALAVSVLQDKVLAPVLGIKDPRINARIDFVGGIRGVEGLTSRVDSGEMTAAFTLCPTTLTELLSVADAGLIMPPKSTWFEPKLLSGLLIHLFG